MLYALMIAIISVMVLICKSRKKADGDNKPTCVLPSEPIRIKQKLPVYWYAGGKKKEGVAEMAQGLQVFDDNENCILDVTDRLCRLLGSHATGTAQGSFTVTGLSGNKLFAFLVGTKAPCDLTINGGTISWQYGSPAILYNMSLNGVIIYGSY
nr:MAG TPA: hypothetical protein [Caudoviricetes sp.]